MTTKTETQQANGVITLRSAFSVTESIDNLEREVHKKKMNIFARINHSAGAQKIGSELRPTELLIFGSPQGGTPLMECTQVIGLDLPLKALAWEDENGVVWLSFNDLTYLAERHQISDCPNLDKLNNVMKTLIQTAAGK
ncbi:DUF302 domain-containing protein [Thiomicrorhabdus xiamenensis]|uniref:DUF302 domain-containing protein n=1 Tax=Thiomicrorhabdus xiamenensis TaxID=2739063 RepID=A0A7D4NMS3_9GAMM|nr:DUF302 domain-containing protein [Thiomicrorhabdus xiamenensis]QKI88153.1 DUF302 domain-containing protein [Thiomicrorhabdus xiamenensis]